MKMFDMLLSKIACQAIKVYRVFRPYVVHSKCIYHPSCSEYSYQAFSRHGFTIGYYLTVERLRRCKACEDSGYDPIPEIISKEEAEKRCKSGNTK